MEIYLTLITTGLLILSSGLGYIIKRQHEKIKEIKLLLFDKKYILYNKIYNIFFDIIKSNKGNKSVNQSAFTKKFIDIKKDLLIYAPDHIVLKFIEWHQSNFENNHLKNSVKLFELYSLIRKDMGYPKSKINELEMLRIIMGNPVDVKKMRQEIDI